MCYGRSGKMEEQMIFQRYRRDLLSVIASIVLVVGVAQSASAHGFNVLLLGSAPDSFTDVYDAFRLATKEQDGHANEESDGHLGGLDVYILTTTDGDDIESTLNETAPDIVVVIGPDAMDPAFQLDVESRRIVFLGVSDISAKMRSEFLENTSDINTGTFQNVFSSAFGRDVSSEAEASYVAARMIAIAVRAQEGVEDRAAIVEILAQY